MMYFLVLAAWLQMQSVAPLVMARFDTKTQCLDFAKVANAHPELNDDESKAKGLQFVCMTLVESGVPV